MADISINPVNNVNITPAPAIRPQQTRTAGVMATQGGDALQGADGGQAAREAQETRQERIRENLEDVISVSRDGDTVQATEESRERLQEDAFGHVEVRQEQNQTTTGEVTEEAIEERTRAGIEGTETQQAIADSVSDRLVEGTRTDEAIAEAVERDVTGTSRTEEAIELGNERAEQEEAEEEYIEKQTSYQGISDMKLEQMYLQGEISKIDFDQEMESREEIREAENNDDAEFSNQITGATVLQERGRQDLQQIEDVFSTEANDNISAEDRMAVIQSLDNQAAQATQNAINNMDVTDANTSGEETIKRVVFS